MKMKKIWCMFMAAALCGSVMAGCGEKEQPQDPVITIVPSEQKNDTTDKEEEVIVETPAELQKPEENLPTESAGTELLHLLQSKQKLVSDKGQVQRTISLSTIGLADDTMEKYPALAEAYYAYSGSEYDVNGMVENLNDYVDLENPLGVSEYCIELNCFYDRCDSQVFSYTENYYTYYGGAHGYYWINGVNFDSQTGEKLELWNVVNDADAFASIVRDTINDIYGNQEYEMEEADMGTRAYDTVLAALEGDSTIQFLINRDGVTVFFAPYEIASYAMGEISVKVLYAAHSSVFNDVYFTEELPVNYFRPVSGNSKVMEEDFDGDGLIEKMYVTNYIDENNEKILTFHYEGESYEIARDVEDSNCYLLYYGDTVYFTSFADGITAYKITTGGPVLEFMNSDYRPNLRWEDTFAWDEEGEWYYTGISYELVSNPAAIYLYGPEGYYFEENAGACPSYSFDGEDLTEND